ncbi:MAG TPA: chromosome segregation protein SMC [Bryobacteraceae bacterium]|nr:chromosome segregation protein SMC [Bryobacteraceae bacterium]
MLKLKRVELQGFKSFCDRSEMRFHGAGVAAIVGPNGCGKSNLSDAISWVLGEQSARSLRGSRMEDVIFAGTRERKPVSMASVTMTLVDPQVHIELPALEGAVGANGHGHSNGHTNGHAHGNGNLHIPTNGHGKPEEITITRRLFRNGDSEYLINGRTARLRDIQDIFMGTGLGPESYAIIEQGRIGQILSTRPQDRRAVIEEAAGITRFKTKKRLAEARLEGAKQNLTRVFDILEEVSRQLNSLKRQASKARRYGELRTEMTVQLRRALAGRFRTGERDATKTALDLNAARAALDELNARVAEREVEQARIQESTRRTEDELTESRRQLSELRLEAERTRGRLQNQANQIGAIEQRLSSGGAESLELDARAGHLDGELGAHTQRLSELERQTGEARQALGVKSAQRDQLQTEVRERERGIEAARQQVLRLLGEASSLRNELAQIDQYLVSVDRDTARITRDEETAGADLERLTAAKDQLSARQSERQLELQSIAEQRRHIESELATRRESAAEAHRSLEQLRNEASRLKARKDSLEEILSHRAYTTESVKRLFTAIEHGRAHDLKPAGVLADFVEVEPAYEKATEEFLHDELEYVVVKDWTQAHSGIDLMRADVDGRATFLVHPEAGDAQGPRPTCEAAIGPDSGIVGRLSDFLRMTNGLTHAPAEMLPRLARCFVARDRAAAQRLAQENPELSFLLPDGVCYEGHAVSGGRKTGSGPLGLKRELRELTGQVQQRQAELDLTRARLEALEQEIAAHTEELERLRALQQSQEKDALALDHDMRKLSEELNRANSRLSIARLDLQRLAQEAERSRTQRDRNLQLVEEKETARAAQEQALVDAREGLHELQQLAAKVGEEHSALRVDLAGFEERRRAEQSARSRIENDLRNLSARRQQLAGDMERLGMEKAHLLADNIELDARAGRLAEAISQGEAEVAKMAEAEGALRASLAAAEDVLKQLRAEVQNAVDQRSHIEVELVRREAELKYLDETCRKELGLGVGELASAEEEILDEAALAEAEQRADELRAKIEALGPVNTEAVEQFDEAQQRYDFLNTQRQDLLDSIRDTEKAIQEIDTESRKRFNQAFEAINANFREMFKTLFSGGVGEMRLTDQDNAADSGIDIVASPPGKKLQSVLLLSGGERALTAMALLMAIFKYQPSPFCVLDEVDAPLDEPNIERLSRLIKEMSGNTQFIVITHARRTMEAAQALYGVTMQEPGISKLVSVRFNEPPSPPLAAAPEPQIQYSVQ